MKEGDQHNLDTGLFNRLEIKVNKDPWTRCFDFLLIEKPNPTREDSSPVYVGKQVTMQYVPEEDEGNEIRPTFKMRPEQVQHLMDELWRNGIRPADGTGSTGQLAATEKHLEDMRKIAFYKVGLGK